MLMCRGCNTRFDSGREACPSCGRRAKTHAVEDGASDSGHPPMTVLPAARPGDSEPDVDTDGIEVELDESVMETEKEEVVVSRPPKPSKPVPAPASRAPAAAPAPPSPASLVLPRRPKPKPAAAPQLSLDAGQVRALLSEQPGLIEKGLGIHADAQGRPVGVDFETPVGVIDLLARDLKRNFVVVMVPEPDDPADDLVPGLLRRMGWVRKHLCHGGESVRTIAIVNELPEAAVYAAAGLSDGAVRFVGYAVTLEFHEHST
jgi:hypothetical protein